MTDHSPSDDRSAAAVIENERGRGKRSYLHYIPVSLYLIAFYVLIKLAGADVRAVMFTMYGYSLTLVEVLQLAASLIAMLELLKVSHPGENNTVEVIFMLCAWIVYLLFFVLGASQTRGFGIFSNTEFLMMIVIFACQVFAGFLLNARTLERSIADNR